MWQHQQQPYLDAHEFIFLLCWQQAGWSIGATCSGAKHVLAKPGGLLKLAASSSIPSE
jgi:hypothetical protein